MCWLKININVFKKYWKRVTSLLIYIDANLRDTTFDFRSVEKAQRYSWYLIRLLFCVSETGNITLIHKLIEFVWYSYLCIFKLGYLAHSEFSFLFFRAGKNLQNHQNDILWNIQFDSVDSNCSYFNQFVDPVKMHTLLTINQLSVLYNYLKFNAICKNK